MVEILNTFGNMNPDARCGVIVIVFLVCWGVSELFKNFKN